MTKIKASIALLAASSCLAQVVPIVKVNNGEMTSPAGGNYARGVTATFDGIYNYVTQTLNLHGRLVTTTDFAARNPLTASITGAGVNISVPVTFLSSEVRTTAGTVPDNADDDYVPSGSGDTFYITTYDLLKNTSLAQGSYLLTIKDNWNETVATGGFSAVPEPEAVTIAAALGLVGFGIWKRRSS